MPDGSVEIRVTGSVDPSVAASANEAKAAYSDLGNSVSVSAKAMAEALAATGGNLKAVTPEMLGLAAAREANAAAAATDAAATVTDTVAKEANTAATINSRAAYESLVLVHEALQGRFSRMAGSSMILTQQLAGQAAVSNAVAFATSGFGLAIIGTVAAIGLLTAATISAENEEKKLTTTTLGLGAQSGLTAEQLKQIGESADSSSQSIRETTKAAEAFADIGLHNIETVKQLSNSIEAYSQLIGVKFAEAQKTLAAAMQDPIKGAKDLHEQLGILDGDQIEQIQTLTALGEKDQAVAIITQALAQRIDEAHQAGVGLRGEFGQLIDVLSNVYNWIGSVTEGFGREAETLMERLIPALHAAGQAHRDAAAAAQQQAQNEAQLNQISAKGAAAFDETPEGRAIKERTELIGKLRDSVDALKVDTALHGANSEAVKRDKEAIEDYRHAVGTYVTEAHKKTEADQLDVKIAEAKHAHNQQLVKDLTEQKALLEQAGKVESDADAKALAAGAGDVAGARVHQPKGPKARDDVVQQWEEQLHEQETLTDNYFADQTAAELKFWQDKLALTKAGSKDWLEVQSKIYQASKTLAKQDYDQHIADLNDRLQADREDWKKEQADWQEKLAYIKSKFGEESTEYKDAHRQMLAEERQHQQQMIQAELSGNSKEIEALKEHLAAMRQVRQSEAAAAEEIIKQQADGEILGEVKAATRIAKIHQQLAEQEIADAALVYQQMEAIRQKGLADTLKADGAESAAYKNELIADKTAYQQFQDQVRQLSAKATAQQIADINAVKQAYHSYIDSTVSAAVSGTAQMLTGQETWRQGVLGILQSLEQTFEQVIERIVENWIVNLLVGKTQQSAVNVASVASYAGVAGAAGVASFAAAPWPIDLGAPAFGAAMAADAASFGSLASLDVGTNYLPRDMVVQAHEGERVIPKADNRKLIQILETKTSITAGAAMPPSVDGAGGDTHLHFHGPVIGSRAAMEQWARQNRHMFGAGMRAYVRGGGSGDPYRPRG